MASQDTTGRQPISPQTRARLQELFNRGNQMMAKGSFDYAEEMFTSCVLGDPANVLYIQNFLANEQKKYNNNKKGSKLAAIKGAGPRAAIKKAGLSKDWKGTIKAGLDFLKLNPWDISTLKAMAAACDELDYEDSQLALLKAALDADINDGEINRLAGRALARVQRYDDAIRCWVRVQKAVPGDPEAAKAIGDLTVEKTINKGGYEGAESTRDAKLQRSDDAAPVGLQMSPERQLEKAIAKDPADASNYVKLAELHLNKDQLDEGEKWLTKAVEVSGRDINLIERLENVQLARMKEHVAIAEKQAREKRTQETVDAFNQMKAELNHREMEVFRGRADRNPNHTGYKYELGVRLHRAGMYKEAIPLLQQAQSDLTRQGEVRLLLGECFQQIKQYSLAMSNYEGAIGSISAVDTERRKLALYRASKLAIGLKDAARANKYLTELAGLDFGYKDTAALLDKLSEIQDKG